MHIVGRYLRFLLVEVVFKSALLCFITTFIIYMLLCITPKTERKDVSIRAERFGIENALQQSPATQGKNKSSRFPMQYIEWVGNLLKGDLGGITSGQKVSEEINVRFPVTFGLSIAAFLPAVFISFLLGMSRDRRGTRIGANTIYLVASLPAFLLGYLLFGIFGANYLAAIITLGLSCGIINEMSRIMGSTMEVEMSRDYIETARAKGLSEASLPLWGTIRFHAFRNAIITIIPRVCILFTLIISGCMVVEQVFRLPGLSYMLIDGLGDKDMDRILVVILLAVVIVRIASILANFLYLLLNPRYGQR